MTPQQIELVQSSFLALPPRRQAAALFYERLFDIDPSVRPLFARTNLDEQGEKLMAALQFVVGALRRPEAMLVTVGSLAARHVRYGVVASQYASVGEALVWTVEQGLGEAASSEILAAWSAAYALLSEAMLASLESLPSSLAARSQVA